MEQVYINQDLMNLFPRSSYRSWAVILFRNVEHCGISSTLGINSGNSVQEWDAIARVWGWGWHDDHPIPESDGIPGIRWNWFRGRNWFQNVQHRGIGCILKISPRSCLQDVSLGRVYPENFSCIVAEIFIKLIIM